MGRKRFVYILMMICMCLGWYLPLSYGQETKIRVIDVGAGLCCAVKFPSGFTMIYDAGRGGKRNTDFALTGINDVVGANEDIELLVLSHTDSDHVGAVPKICKYHKVKKVIRAGMERESKTWRLSNWAIQDEVKHDGCKDIQLKDETIVPGAILHDDGDEKVIFVAGWCYPPAEWGLGVGTGKYRNAGSIVIKLIYKGASVLFSGDTLGLDTRDPQNPSIAAELVMVNNDPDVPLVSDILIAAHHGSESSNSWAFIEAIHPRYVIFSAGHSKDAHPRAITARRFIDFGVIEENIFRTDRGDDDGDDEWDYLRIYGNVDVAGDDDVDIIISGNGSIEINYRIP